MGPFVRLGTDERGAALIIALAILSLMLVIGTTVVTLSMNSEKTVGNDQRISMAQNVAESGVDDVIAVTVANYYTVYPGGNIPTTATAFYDAPQQMNDGQGNAVGTYQVWTHRDPNSAGNVLVTATGYDLSGNETRTVRVSIKYTPDVFNYVLLPGKQTSTTTATFRARSTDYDGHHGDEDHDYDDDGHGYASANIALTGKIGVNGNMTFDTSQTGDDWGHDDEDHHDSDHEYYQAPGTVTFLSRDGYTDTATYTGSKSGPNPIGNQPVRAGYVAFPTATLASSTNVRSITLPNASTYTGGWTRNSYTRVWSISAANFQAAYGSYNAVRIYSAVTSYQIRIVGDCNSPEITTTIWTERTTGGNSNISAINLEGPGIRLQPRNGIAIMADRGTINMTNEVIIGKQGAGALVYAGAKNGTTALNVTGNLLMYGSVVVSGPVTFDAQGSGFEHHDHEHDDEHDHGHSTGSCTGDYNEDHENDDWHHNWNHRVYSVNIDLQYDDAFLANVNLPAGWWTWTGTGELVAIKENYEVL
ncbi:MAG: PilX N-terminal domain-containing pilus assembly protein [Thermoleophilia bacterium]